MTQPARKPRFGISLRAAMILVLVVGVALAWRIQRARTMREAVAVIKAGDGQVLYDFQFAGALEESRPKVDPKGEPKVPGWLRRAAGDEIFEEVTSVSFGGDNPSPKVWESVSKLHHLISLDFHILDAKLERVSGLRSLNRLKNVKIGFQMLIDETTLDEFGAIPNLESFTANIWLTDTDIERVIRARTLVEIDTKVKNGDKSIAHLAKLPRLKSIKLVSGNGFSDQSLHFLAPILPNLEKLSLTPSFIDDEGLVEFAACRRLKELYLTSGIIGTEGAKTLGELKSLEVLNLQSVMMGDDVLAELRGLKNLTTLSVSGLKITDEGLAHLAELPRLKQLSLTSARITDIGLDQVRKMKSLENLWLDNLQAPLSQASINALRAARPKLKLTTNTRIVQRPASK